MSTTTVAEPEPDLAVPAAKAATTPAPNTPPPKDPSFFQRHRTPLLVLGGIIAAIVLLFYFYDAYTHEETDDAYVTGHLHNWLSPTFSSMTTSWSRRAMSWSGSTPRNISRSSPPRRPT
jgi:hypothetical protein